MSAACRRRARGRSRIGTSSSSPLHDLDEWLAAVVATPGLTSLASPDDARRVLLEDSLRGVELVARFDGPVVDVGSGGGAPGIPLAHALPEREVVLLEAERRKAEFLERWAPPNARAVWGRAEEQETDWAGVAVAKALAQPPTAAEWCLPLVREGGAAILWVGPTADPARVAAVAARLAAELEEAPAGFLVLRKLGPTPSGYPRRTGMAKKRPLA
jgi:16S rRNA (guanine527-N7)-methyltransferase